MAKRNKYAITYSDNGSVLKIPGKLFTPADGGAGKKNIDVAVISKMLGTFPITDFRLVAVTISSTSSETAAVEGDNGLTVQTDYTLKPIRVKPTRRTQEGFGQSKDPSNQNSLLDFKGKLDYIEIAIRFENL